MPFDVSPSAAVGPAGFYITAGKEPDIFQYESATTLRRVVRLTEPPRRVTEEDLRRYVDGRLAGVSDPGAAAAVRSVYEQMAIPQWIPAFQSLHVDDAGWLWAELYRVSPVDSALWLVFDPEGYACGTVQLPAALEVHQIGLDFILGRARDDLEVEHVIRYALQRHTTVEAPPGNKGT